MVPTGTPNTRLILARIVYCVLDIDYVYVIIIRLLDYIADG
jgi:hypothetical protein